MTTRSTDPFLSSLSWLMPAPALNPLQAWGNYFSVAMKTGVMATELVIASQQTIAQRAALLAGSSWPPSKALQKEIFIMGSEKVTAANAAASAWLGSAPALNQQMTELSQAPWDMSSTLLAYNSLETVADFQHAQQQWLQSVWKSQRAVLEFWSSAARAAQGSLRHYHAPAMANARRLTK